MPGGGGPGGPPAKGLGADGIGRFTSTVLIGLCKLDEV